ncbi:MAG TPA: sigma-70 family RNA polymerase sigma factor, partial [Fimbriimonadaceae bacterium]|nr:sigma-70 family RNA polymerase sigma factor [Fimbriimonadaceae bacterium]
MELLAAVNAFASGKPEHAPVVMERLRTFLWRYLAGYAPDASDREDIIAEVHLRLWGRKGKLEFPTLGAFWAYTAKTARSIALNRIRSEIPTEEFDEQLSVEDGEFVDTIAEASGDRERLYALADELWLGTEASGSAGRTRLLALQLYYLHGQSVQEIAELLVGSTMGDRRQVSGWLEDGALLLGLCYHESYFDNDRLAAHVLDSKNPPTSTELDQL